MKPPQVKLKHLLNWLNKQNSNRTFNYVDNRNCLLCNFFKEFHGLEVSVSEDKYRLVGQSKDEDYEPLPEFIEKHDLIDWCQNLEKAKQDLLWKSQIKNKH